MTPGWFVDLHSHVAPSGDDGAQSMDEGAELCLATARHGTRTLFATPHVGAHADHDEEREALVAERVEAPRPARSGAAGARLAAPARRNGDGGRVRRPPCEASGAARRGVGARAR